MHATGPDGEPLALGYDTLIVAAGARGAPPGEWAALAPPLKSLADARRVRSRVLGAFERAELAADPEERDAWMTFAVVGGGPTGVELAGQIAELARRTLRPDFGAVDTAAARIALLEAGPGLLPDHPSRLGARAARDLDRLGVTVRTGARGDRHRRRRRDDAGSRRAADVPARTVAVGGRRLRVPARRRARRGRGRRARRRRAAARPRPTSRSPATPRCSRSATWSRSTACRRSPPPRCSRDGTPAYTVRRRLAGRSPEGRFRYLDKGSLAVIGRGRAVGVAFGMRVTGALAFLVWALVHVALPRRMGQPARDGHALDVVAARPQPRRARDRSRVRPPRAAGARRGAGVSAALAAVSGVAVRTPRATRRATAAHGALLRRVRLGLLRRWFGMPLLVLETTGRRTASGAARRSPTCPTATASSWWRPTRARRAPPRGGSTCAPRARGSPTSGPHRVRVVASEAHGDERARLWRRDRRRRAARPLPAPHGPPAPRRGPATRPDASQRSLKPRP